MSFGSTGLSLLIAIVGWLVIILAVLAICMAFSRRRNSVDVETDLEGAETIA